MKHCLLVCSIVVLFLCSCQKGENISEEDVIMDWESGYCFYKDDSLAVNGVVDFSCISADNQKWIGYTRTFLNGNLNGIARDYYSNGAIWIEKHYQNCRLDSVFIEYYSNGRLKDVAEFENGLLTGQKKEYDEYGILIEESQYVDGKLDGEKKFYSKNKLQTKLEIYENGELLKVYDFDEKGQKIIPLTEKLEIVTIKTGFYEYRDLNSYKFLYQPIVLVKVKNASKEVFKKSIKLRASFYCGNDEWSNETDYLHSYSDAPWEPQLNRQATLQSSVGYTNYAGIGTKTIKCRIYVEDELLKTLTIRSKLLTSNVL